jgi:hypothetical protein
MSVLPIISLNSLKSSFPSLIIVNTIKHRSYQQQYCVRSLTRQTLHLPILVCLHDRLVYNLLQLLVFQIVTNHHFENKKELSIGDESIAIHIIDFECDCQIRKGSYLRKD